MIALESSLPMFGSYQGKAKIVHADACTYDYEGNTDVVISYLSLMFNTPDKRRVCMDKIKKCLRWGGAFILVEKFAPSETGYAQLAINRLSLAGKVAAGISGNEIVDKELSLSGSQLPLSVSELSFLNPQLIEFFRAGDFRGFLYQKESMADNTKLLQRVMP